MVTIKRNHYKIFYTIIRLWKDFLLLFPFYKSSISFILDKGKLAVSEIRLYRNSVYTLYSRPFKGVKCYEFKLQKRLSKSVSYILGSIVDVTLSLYKASNGRFIIILYNKNIFEYEDLGQCFQVSAEKIFFEYMYRINNIDKII